MDPYVEIELGSLKQRTKVHNSGGKNPRWEETLKFKVINETELKLSVFDKDLTSDDLVGNTIVFLDEVKKQGKY